MAEPPVTGVNPWLPWPLPRWPWWTRPVRAERLAALRVGVGLVLLIDVLGHYLPRATDHLARFTQEIMRGPAPLSPGLRELIAAYTSRRNDCPF